eukprot:Nk52_evm8s2568 gene=Nk52_evmTU8s2568
MKTRSQVKASYASSNTSMFLSATLLNSSSSSSSSSVLDPVLPAVDRAIVVLDPASTLLLNPRHTHLLFQRGALAVWQLPSSSSSSVIPPYCPQATKFVFVLSTFVFPALPAVQRLLQAYLDHRQGPRARINECVLFTGVSEEAHHALAVSFGLDGVRRYVMGVNDRNQDGQSELQAALDPMRTRAGVSGSLGSLVGRDEAGEEGAEGRGRMADKEEEEEERVYAQVQTALREWLLDIQKEEKALASGIIVDVFYSGASSYVHRLPANNAIVMPCGGTLLYPHCSWVFPLLHSDIKDLNYLMGAENGNPQWTDLELETVALNQLPRGFQMEMKCLADAVLGSLAAGGMDACEFFSLGQSSSMLCKEMIRVRNAQRQEGRAREQGCANHTKASVVVIDRTMDLVGVTGHGDNLADRLFGKLPRPVVAAASGDAPGKNLLVADTALVNMCGFGKEDPTYGIMEKEKRNLYCKTALSYGITTSSLLEARQKHGLDLLGLDFAEDDSGKRKSAQDLTFTTSRRVDPMTLFAEDYAGNLIDSMDEESCTLFNNLIMLRFKQALMSVRKSLMQCIANSELDLDGIGGKSGKITPEQLQRFLDVFIIEEDNCDPKDVSAEEKQRRDKEGEMKTRGYELNSSVLEVCIGVLQALTTLRDEAPSSEGEGISLEACEDNLWDQLLSAEKVLMLTAIDTEERASLVPKLINLVQESLAKVYGDMQTKEQQSKSGKTGKKEGQGSEGFALDDLLIMFIHCFSILGSDVETVSDESFNRLMAAMGELAAAIQVQLEYKQGMSLGKEVDPKDPTQEQMYNVMGRARVLLGRLNSVAYAREGLTAFSQLHNKSGYKPIVQSVLEAILKPSHDRNEVPDINHETFGMRGILNAGFSSVFGLGSTKQPKVTENEVLYIFVLGGISCSEIKLLQESTAKYLKKVDALGECDNKIRHVLIGSNSIASPSTIAENVLLQRNWDITPATILL